MSNTSDPHLSSVFSQTFLQTITASYVGLEECIWQEKVEGVHEFYAILMHLASASSPALVLVLEGCKYRFGDAPARLSSAS